MSALSRISKCLPLVPLVAAFPMAAQAADWSDALIRYSYGQKFKDPGSPDDVEKHVVTLQYVGGYKYGVNFFTLDMLKSDSHNPASGGNLGTNSKRGAQEVYVVFNTTVSLGKVRGTPVKFGPVRDVGLQAGFDFNSKNDTFGAGLIKFIAGPKLEFDVPGLLTLGLLYYKENNNNAIAAGTGAGSGNVNFKGTARLATVWDFGFSAGAPAVFKGWATYTGKKGKDGFGGDTAPETWLETSLLWDLGSFAGKPKTFYAGIGYQYIKNKFGNQPSLAGTKVSSPSIQAEVHF